MNIGYVIGIISLFVAFITIPITFFVARRSRQLPDLRHAIDFDVILNPSDRLLDRGLTMKVGDHSINCISRSRIALWNHRGDTVRGADIVDSDPLRIQFAEGDSALQVRILGISRPQNKLVPTINLPDEAAVNITFDFLDAGDGAILEVVHQGTEPPAVLGTLRGARIRNYGKVRLGPENLEAVKKSLLFRFLDYSPISVVLSQIFSIFMGLVAAILAVVLAATASKQGHLVNASQYNLRTLTGQGNFANAVNGAGNQNTTQNIVLIAILTLSAIYLLTTALRTIRRRSRRIVPKSVVALIVDDNMQRRRP